MRNRTPVTEKGIARIAQYNKDNTTSVNLRLFPSDEDIRQHLDALDEPKASYIKRLIREDMEKQK